MKRGFKRSGLIFLSLISLTLLIPNIGFGGAETPCGLPVLPAYFGNVTVEWQSTNIPGCGLYNSTCGNVIVYGRLNCAEKHCEDIIITRKDHVIVLTDVGQVDFLTLEPINLSFLQTGLSITWKNKCYGATSVNDLSYQTERLFTVEVVVMQMQ